jgi:hypothetical protein
MSIMNSFTLILDYSKGLNTSSKTPISKFLRHCTKLWKWIKGLRKKNCHKLGNLFAVKSSFMMGNSAFPAKSAKKNFNDPQKNIYLIFMRPTMWTSETTHIKNCREQYFFLCGVLWLHSGSFLCAWSRREIENRFLNIFLSLLERESEKRGRKGEKVHHPETVSMLITLIHSHSIQLLTSSFSSQFSGKSERKGYQMMNHNCSEFPINYASNFAKSRSELWWSINNYWIIHCILKS